MSEANEAAALKPWYYRSPWRDWLLPLSRVLRNAALGGGFATGLLWMLVGGPAALMMMLFRPEQFDALVATYYAAPVGAGAGLLAGLYAARLFARRFPENKKGPLMVLPICVGLGGFAGLAATFFGLGGALGMLLLFGLAFLGYFYIQGSD